MARRLILIGVLAAALSACGGSDASSSPSGTASASAGAGASASLAAPTSAPAASDGATAEPAASEDPAETSTAICDGVSLRKQPSSSAARVKAIGSGTAVHVVATVSGTAYRAVSCGTSGDTWLKIDKVAGKTVKSVYGVSFVYAAAGFFE